MAESRASFRAMSDEAFGAALRDLGAAVAFPSAAPVGAPDVATRVRVRIASAPLPTARRPWFGRPAQRGLVLALAALLILAAVAGAVGLGLPGIRIIFGEATPPPVSSTPATATATATSLGPVGATLGLGTIVSLADGERVAGIDALLPPDSDIGAPDAVFVAHQRLALVWKASTALPEAAPGGVGLVLNEFRGDLSDGYFQKVIGEDVHLTPVSVGGSPGYWMSGPPHFFMYVDPSGNIVDDSHRSVGDTLIWTSGELTFRLESALSMDDAIRLAESLR